MRKKYDWIRGKWSGVSFSRFSLGGATKQNETTQCSVLSAQCSRGDQTKCNRINYTKQFSSSPWKKKWKKKTVPRWYYVDDVEEIARDNKPKNGKPKTTLLPSAGLLSHCIVDIRLSELKRRHTRIIPLKRTVLAPVKADFNILQGHCLCQTLTIDEATKQNN